MIHGLQLLIIPDIPSSGTKDAQLNVEIISVHKHIVAMAECIVYTYSYIDKDISHIHCADYAFGNVSTYFFKQNKIPWYKPIHNPNYCLLYLMHMYYCKTK